MSALYDLPDAGIVFVSVRAAPAGSAIAPLGAELAMQDGLHLLITLAALCI